MIASYKPNSTPCLLSQRNTNSFLENLFDSSYTQFKSFLSHIVQSTDVHTASHIQTNDFNNGRERVGYTTEDRARNILRFIERQEARWSNISQPSSPSNRDTEHPHYESKKSAKFDLPFNMDDLSNSHIDYMNTIKNSEDSINKTSPRSVATASTSYTSRPFDKQRSNFSSDEASDTHTSSFTQYSSTHLASSTHTPPFKLPNAHTQLEQTSIDNKDTHTQKCVPHDENHPQISSNMKLNIEPIPHLNDARPPLGNSPTGLEPKIMELPYIDAANHLILKWSSPLAYYVEVSGTFSNPPWQKRFPLNWCPRMSFHWIDIHLAVEPNITAQGGPHQFKYIVDGQWMCNPLLPICDDGNHNLNNVVVIFPESIMRKTFSRRVRQSAKQNASYPTLPAPNSSHTHTDLTSTKHTFSTGMSSQSSPSLTETIQQGFSFNSSNIMNSTASTHTYKAHTSHTQFTSNSTTVMNGFSHSYSAPLPSHISTHDNINTHTKHNVNTHKTNSTESNKLYPTSGLKRSAATARFSTTDEYEQQQQQQQQQQQHTHTSYQNTLLNTTRTHDNYNTSRNSDMLSNTQQIENYNQNTSDYTVNGFQYKSSDIQYIDTHKIHDKNSNIRNYQQNSISSSQSNIPTNTTHYNTTLHTPLPSYINSNNHYNTLQTYKQHHTHPHTTENYKQTYHPTYTQPLNRCNSAYDSGLEAAISNDRIRRVASMTPGCWPPAVTDLLHQPETLLKLNVPIEAREKTDLTLQFGAYMIPHPDKLDTKGADAFFTCHNHNSRGGCVGVADGVGEWDSMGLNPRKFAEELMNGCMKSYKDNLRYDLCLDERTSHILKEGYDYTRSFGSATALVACLDENGEKIGIANLGDSAMILLRRQKVYNMTTVYRSQEQQHHFNCPYQLTRLPHPSQYDQLIKEGNETLVRVLKNSTIMPQDTISMAHTSSFDVIEGDLILLGTDGVFDNLFDFEICALANLTLSPYEALLLHNSELETPASTVATAIAEAASYRSKDNIARTPFMKHARENGTNFIGGKLDDITVVACWVTRSPKPNC